MRRLALIVLDGAGYSTDPTGNAVTAESMPRFFQTLGAGKALLEASGLAVGLEEGQVGNSEVGHLTLGAGRVVPSMTRRLAESYEDGSWARNAGWSSIAKNGVLHITGLLSDAGVHGLVRTIVHSATLAGQAGVGEIVVHPILDGVDSQAGSAPALLDDLRAQIAGLPGVRLGVIVGRKNFCDRSGNLDVSREVVRALTGQVALPVFEDHRLVEHLEHDPSEMSFPAHQVAGGRPIAPGECVLISNNRADRIRQVTKVLSETQRMFMIVDPGDEVPVEHIFFPLQVLSEGFAYELKKAGLSSVRVAEKCKFPHVTFFFNGFDTGAEGDGVCIPSILEAEIRNKPEMSIDEVTDTILRTFQDPNARVLVANICNLDQVGHLGRMDLALQAADVVDDAYRRLVDAAREHGWTVLVTADHGCGDRVLTDDGAPFGSHTDRPVPFGVEPAPGLEMEWNKTEGSLANVAATCMDALGLEIPSWMSPPLVKFRESESS